MTALIVCGDRGALRETLLPLLEPGGVWLCGGGALRQYGGGQPEFLLYESRGVPALALDQGILLFGSDFCGKGRELPSGVIAVFETGNHAAAQALQGTGTLAIACGASPQDTLSASSLEDHRAFVSLQRTVKNLRGEILEPRESAVRYRRRPELYPLLAASAVRLLTAPARETAFAL